MSLCLTMQQEQEIDSIFHRWQKGLCPGGQVLVRRKGEVIYDKSFGYANLEHKIPVGENTVFHVASVSKQVTVLSLLLLVEEGKVHLTDDIREYAPELILFREPVTLYDLVHNISGIRDQWELLMMRGVRIDDTITMEDLKRMISMQTILNFEPGSEYLYSNSNFTLIAHVVEKVSGLSLGEFAAQRIFAPLGMDHTCIKTAYTQVIPGRAYSYDDDGEGTFTYHPINYSAYGATSLHTTVRDLMKLLENYKNPTICRKETVEKMMERPVLADGSRSIYGGGLMLGEYEGHPFLEHGGVDAAYRAHTIRFYDPEDDLDIAIVSNTQNTIPGVAARQIARVVLGLEEEKPQHQQHLLEQAPQQEETGVYWAEEPSLACFTVCRDQEGQLHLGGENGTTLHHVEGNCYRIGYLEDVIYLGKEKAACQMGANLYPLVKVDTASQDTDFLLEYEGTYQSDEVDTRYFITEEEGFLYASHTRHGQGRLYPLGRDRYGVQIGGLTLRLTFTRGSGNRFTGLVMDGGRVQHLGFTREEM